MNARVDLPAIGYSPLGEFLKETVQSANAVALAGIRSGEDIGRRESAAEIKRLKEALRTLWLASDDLQECIIEKRLLHAAAEHQERADRILAAFERAVTETAELAVAS